MNGRILFDTIAAGGGHVATARAMRDAVEAASDGRIVGEVRDTMSALGLERKDREHKRAWARLLRVPWLVRLGQRAMEVSPPLVHAFEARWLDGLARRLAADPVVQDADLVVVNHGFLMVGYARAQRRYGLRRSVVTFATEPFDANALWAEPHADRVIAPSHEARTHLIRLGIPEPRIDVVGYPVASAILHAPARDEARRLLGLDDGRWALLSMGGEGVAGTPERWIDALLACGWNVMAIAGRNERLFRTLTDHPFSGSSLRVHGFVDDMPVRLTAADVVIGKAGPASVLEAVAAGRPFVATSYAGLNERAVIDFLERTGLGRHLRSPASLSDVLEPMIADASKAPRPDFRHMSDALGRHLVELASDRAPAAPIGLGDDPWTAATVRSS